MTATDWNASARTVNRPPLAYGRLRQLDSGNLDFALKTPWKNGTTHLVFAPLEFIGRLVALTPTATPASGPLPWCPGIPCRRPRSHRAQRQRRATGRRSCGLG